ncbi:MAG: DUF1343 domain-containing protein [Acidobacteria bacterium]|nr:DUF1343 domain-containing protein [Acidobacteriota bacterium]MBV9477079.1 DUF1343 domain-containing protein [Acidobacteriota bacterium]
MRRARLLLFLLAAACATAPAPPPHATSPSFDAAKLTEIDAAIDDAVAHKRIPGGVLWIEHDGDTYHRAYGKRALTPDVEWATEDTIYDIASLTKVVATAPSIWLLIADGKIALDAPARMYLPELADDAITVRHLLTHTSGLRPDLDLHEQWMGYDEGIRHALAEKPRHRPGTVFIYSDINYILLGEIVHRVSGETLDDFAFRRIFTPLGMTDTNFQPSQGVVRIAPTERLYDDPLAPDPVILRGVVHDPTARRMDGVAGHAGLFSTAADLAKFARAVLAGNFFPREMTEIATPPEMPIKRAAGFDVDSAYSRPRGDLFPIGSFGHTGWTGGFFWIDPSSHAFYIFLSNRVHPNGQGSVTALQQRLGTLVAESLRGATFTPVPRRVGWVTGGGAAQNGIDVLDANGYAALRGLRIGLITNQTGIDHAGNLTIDLLRGAPDVTLVSVFSPEHGISGIADDNISDDRIRGLPLYSLYGDRRKPLPEQLANLDALVFDIQDIGTRFYTYISTMGLAMEAAADAKIKFIVLDRVNPIGGDVVEGPVLQGDTNFTGFHPIAIRHGMTVGELARMFRAERKIDVDLTVIPVHGWARNQWQDEAGLPWVNPSPNIRSLDAAALYPGLGLLERALSVGRGTDTPFEIVGAPYIEGAVLARELRGVRGVSFTPIRFTPTASTFANTECGGLRIAITNRRQLRSVELGVAIASALVRLYPSQFAVDEIEPLLRDKETLNAIRAGRTLDDMRVFWRIDAFLARRAKYLTRWPSQ